MGCRVEELVRLVSIRFSIADEDSFCCSRIKFVPLFFWNKSKSSASEYPKII
jgi:hypothetical protein